MEHTQEKWVQFGTTYASNPKQTMKRQSNNTELERYWWISDHGRVKITTNYNDAVKWPKLSLTGGQRTRYLAISNNNLIEKYVHRLVARFFIGVPQTDERMTVDHINGNKLDNHYTNLEWVTYKENIRRYWDTRRANGKQEDSDYITIADEVLRTRPRVDRDQEVIELYQQGFTCKSIKEQLGLTNCNVQHAVKQYRLENNITGRNRKN